MKKLLTALLITALVTMSFCLAEGAEPADPTADYIGMWVDPIYGRATLRIMPSPVEGECAISIHWGNSASSEGVWLMTGVWNAEAGELQYENGVMKDVTYGENGYVAGEEVLYDDAVGAFALDGEGKLLWRDSREERAAEFHLENIPVESPSAEAFAQNYFAAIANAERGTAGSSLKMALISRDVLRFAMENMLWTVNQDDLKASLAAAWTSLTDEQRAAFPEIFFDGAVELIDSAFTDYESVQGLFGDAGAEDMRYLAQDEDAAASWEALLNATLAMSAGE